MARPASTEKKAKAKEISKEMSNAIKAFKASSEVEEFYRFIHDNNLRHEASVLTKLVLRKLNPTKRKSKIIQ